MERRFSPSELELIDDHLVEEVALDVLRDNVVEYLVYAFRHQRLGDVVIHLDHFFLLRVVVELEVLGVALFVLCDSLQLSG